MAERLPILRTALDVLRCSYASEPAVAERQRQRFVHLLRLARERSGFYRNLYAHLPDDIADPRQLPFVTKPELMEHFDEVVTDPTLKRVELERFLADLTRIGEPYLGRYFVCTTSGTTGRPGIFIHDEFAWLLYQLLGVFRGGRLILDAGLKRLFTRSPRVVLLAVGGGHFGGAAGFAWRQRIHPRLARFRRMVTVLDPLADQVKALNDFQPSIIAGYPSAIAVLAEEQGSGRLQIDPALIIFAGEWLAAPARRRIERAFRCPVRNFYGASECFGIAYECSEAWLHVNSDWVILEPVDRSYRPVAAGTPSHTVLLTNLANAVQPLIRYDLGDSIVSKPAPCRCGRRLPAIRLEGRKSDVLSLPSADGHSLIRILPLALATVIEETSGVYRFQAVQVAPGSIEVRLDVKPDAAPEQVWKNVADAVGAFLARQGVGAVELRRSTQPPSPSPISGKFQQVQVAGEFEKYLS